MADSMNPKSASEKRNLAYDQGGAYMGRYKDQSALRREAPKPPAPAPVKLTVAAKKKGK